MKTASGPGDCESMTYTLKSSDPRFCDADDMTSCDDCGDDFYDFDLTLIGEGLFCAKCAEEQE